MKALDAATAWGRLALGCLAAVLLLLPLAVHPGIYSSYYLPRTCVLEVGALATLACWVASLAAGGTGGLARTGRLAPIACPAAALGLLNGAGCLRGEPGALAEGLRVASALGLFLVARQVVRTRSGARVLAGAMTIALATVAALGLAQVAGLELGLYRQLQGAASSFGHYNHAAQWLVQALPVALGLALDRGAPRVLRALAWTTVPAAAAFALLLGSRGGALALAAVATASLALTAWRSPPRRWVPGVLLVVAGLAAAALVASRTSLPHAALERVTGLLGSSGWAHRSRLPYWRATLAMAADHPLRGVGPGQWEREIPRYAVLLEENEGTVYNLTMQFRRAHNDYLQVLAELGAPGLGAMAALVAAVAACLTGHLRALRTGTGPGPEAGGPVAAGAAAGALGALAHAVVDFPFQLSAGLGSFWVLCGMAEGLSLAGGSTRGPALDRHPRGTPMRVGLALVLGAASVLAAGGHVRRMEADQHYLEARDLGDAGRLADAVTPALRATVLAPREPTYRIYLASALVEAGRPEEALAELDHALELWPLSLTGRVNRAVVLVRLGRLEEAYEDLLLATAWNPYLQPAYEQLGLVAHAQGRLHAALTYYQTAASLPPSELITHRIFLNLGTTYRALGMWERAASCYEASRAYLWSYAPATLNLGIAYRALGRNEDAVREFRAFLAMPGADPRAVDLVRQHLAELGAP
ncbi:MAG: O-antigen ligase family protein [Planctomycetes bacterium]|nr:O-antigen ligase family protein [Planctomycetota bacterium]